MASAGNIAGRYNGKQQGLITNTLAYITIQVNPMHLQGQLVRILKILQILKKVTRMSTREEYPF